jgi:hypothetical protein
MGNNESVELQKITAINTGETVISLDKVYANTKTLVAEAKKNTDNNKNIFSNIKNTFNLKSLQSSLANAFARTAKTFTSPFTAINRAFTSSIVSIKGFLTNLTPLKAINAIKDKYDKTKGTIQKFIGTDLDTLKRKFLINWSDPKKVFDLQLILGEKRKNKQIELILNGNNKETKSSKLKLFTKPTNYELKTSFYREWNKPAKVAKIWSKEFNKTNKITKEKGTEATLGQVYGQMMKEIKGISNTLKTLLNPVGIGLAIAVGVTPSALMLSGALVLVAYMVTQTLEKLGNPIVTVLTDIGTKIGKILDRILTMINSPVTTIVSGVKTTISKVGTMLKDNGEVSEGQELNTMLFRIYQNWSSVYTNILNKLTNNYNSLQNNYLKPLTKSLQEYVTKSLEYYDLSKYSGTANISDKVINSFADSAKNIMSRTAENAKNIYRDLKNSIKNVWTSNTTTKLEKNTKQINTDTNPFSEMISSFNEMKAETVKLLTSINKGIIEISKNKLKINNLNVPGTASTSDTKQMNTPLQVIKGTNTTKIENIMNTISTDIKSIVQNTAKKEIAKASNNAATWVID